MLILLIGTALACSTVFFNAGDVGQVIGRTMELDTPLPWRLATHEKGDAYKGYPMICDSTLIPFVNNYNYVGTDATSTLDGMELTGSSDGMNEMGLTISAQTLSTSQYANRTSVGSTTICHSDMIAWVLGTFESVQEFINYHAKYNLQIVGPRFKLPAVYYTHWGLSDPTGNYVVIEVLDGTISITPNTVGVMTNQPNFRWHLTNLNNGININQFAPDPIEDIAVDTVVGRVPSFQGHGFNLMGLPGDISPPSRFIKLFYLKQLSLLEYPPSTLNDSVALVTALLNTVYIPHGTVGGSSSDKQGLHEFTQYSIIKMPKRRELYFKGYYGSTWKRVQLDHLNFQSKKQIPISSGAIDVLDVTFDF